MSAQVRGRCFGQRINDAAAAVELVRREALEECPPDHRLAMELDACVEDAVRNLWDSRIKTYVPLLALRQVRCCLRAGSCDCGEC